LIDEHPSSNLFYLDQDASEARKNTSHRMIFEKLFSFWY